MDPMDGDQSAGHLKKKRVLVEDDFFSLLFAKKPKKHRKKRTHDTDNISSDRSEIPSDKPEVSSDKLELGSEAAASQISASAPDSLPVSDHESITPPPEMDREALRSIIEERMKEKEVVDVDEGPMSDNDSDDLDLDFFKPSKSESPRANLYQFSEENEKQRRYIIRVVTKLPTPKDYDPNTVAEFGTRGIKKFGRILEAIVDYYRGLFKGTRRLDPVYLSLYTPENTALIWVDGKCEIKPFFKPCTFRIPPETTFDITTDQEVTKTTYLNCLLIPRENTADFLSLYSEFKPSKPSQTVEDEVEEEVQMVETVEKTENLGISNPKDTFFIIGIKGKDNKRIEVQVSPKTEIRNLLVHYLKTKNIDPKSINMDAVKLIFDDEEMDMDAVVGDTELEEDFEVQVVI